MVFQARRAYNFLEKGTRLLPDPYMSGLRTPGPLSPNLTLFLAQIGRDHLHESTRIASHSSRETAFLSRWSHTGASTPGKFKSTLTNKSESCSGTIFFFFLNLLEWLPPKYFSFQFCLNERPGESEYSFFLFLSFQGRTRGIWKKCITELDTLCELVQQFFFFFC